MNNTINALHAAFEYSNATLGGLGSVVTQLHAAQNNFIHTNMPSLISSVITPYYRKIFTDSENISLIGEVEHIYNDLKVHTKLFLRQTIAGAHYMLDPFGEDIQLFDLPSARLIYADTAQSNFIDRIKYYNSALAATLHAKILPTQPDVVLIHDWHVALSAKILRELYNSYNPKFMFILHVDIADNGTYPSESLSGLGLDLRQQFYSLKAIGCQTADKIIAVSPQFLQKSMQHRSKDINTEIIRRMLIWSYQNEHKALGITNGIDYAKYCPLGKTIFDPTNIANEKIRLKELLYQKIVKTKAKWQFDISLPIILYIGRFAPEKGVDTFAQVITAIAGQANFFALGRGMTESLRQLIDTHQAKTNNIYITNSSRKQQQIGELLRACADFTFVPSLSEACGLVPMEGYANGAMCIASNVLHDSLIMRYTYIFDIQDQTTLNMSLRKALQQALCFWRGQSTAQRSQLQHNIMQDAKRFDWLAPQGAVFKYTVQMQEMKGEKQSIGIKNLALRLSGT